MAQNAVIMIFDFDKKLASLSGLTKDTIEKKIELLACYKDTWNTTYFFEYPLKNTGEKWVFTWNQWAEHEQFFKLEHYNSLGETNPWTTLAQWSYIAHPQLGTKQKNKIYRTIYNSNMLMNNHVIFEVKGSPSVENWNTIESVDGYWY